MKPSEYEDLFIAAIARELKAGEQLHVGANQTDVALAAHLARRLWAPGLRMNAGGSWLLGLDSDLDVLGRSSYEPLLVEERASSFWQARAFDDLLRAPIVFAGGLQVDSRGNANLAGIRDGDGWSLRGPGSAGLPTLTTFAKRFYLVIPDHQPRFLVDRVSAISVVGDPDARRDLGLDPAALRAVITPLARFEPTPDGLLLTELSPGVEESTVSDMTGFEIRAGAELRRRPGLSPDEREGLAELRARATRNQR